MGRYGANTLEGVRQWTAEQLAKIEKDIPVDPIPVPRAVPDFGKPSGELQVYHQC